MLFRERSILLSTIGNVTYLLYRSGVPTGVFTHACARSVKSAWLKFIMISLLFGSSVPKRYWPAEIICLLTGYPDGRISFAETAVSLTPFFAGRHP